MTTGAVFVRKYREVLISVGVAGAGAWLALRGGVFFGAMGLVLAAGAGVWGVTALRRVRFTRDTAAPGLVEVVEGRIGYFGAGTVMGGHVSLDDLAEIRLIPLSTGIWWRLKTTDGQALLIPVQARGAETLYDAFAALPGIDMGYISTALNGAETGRSLWRRAQTSVPLSDMRAP